MSGVADVRVFLFTYRRGELLPRAVQSLLAQTHSNWVCELHNDDPDDSFPEELVQRLGDPRITYVRHAKNLGPTATFNLAFAAVREPFVAILEDDNWWEPSLLERLLSALARHPDAQVAWGNMWLWQQRTTDQWDNAGTVWPHSPDSAEELFNGPHPRQVCGSLHSNGAMLVRSSSAARYVVPDFVPFFAMESFRDRLLDRPLVLLKTPIANLAITRETSRSETADDNLQVLTLLAMTALSWRGLDRAFYRRVWIECRGWRGHRQRALVAAALASGRMFRLCAAATPGDLAIVMAWIIRHPVRFARMVGARRRHPSLYAFLERASMAEAGQS